MIKLPNRFTHGLLPLALSAALFNVAQTGNAGTLAALTFDTSTLAADVEAAKGTVDTYQGSASNALVLNLDTSVKNANIATEQIAVTNTEADLAKLTFSFDLNISALQPVRAIISSYDTKGKFTGSRVATVHPPVAGSYYRFGIDLDKTSKLKGKFDPLAPKVSFAFETASKQNATLAIDNISYTAPSFYVSPTGDDNADGRTAKTAFATPQRAADAAKAGDVVLLMEGKYTSLGNPDISDVPKATQTSGTWRPWWVEKSGGNVTIKNAGSPAAWIVVRNHPGHKPVLFNAHGWHGVRFGLTASYVEVRGLTIQGDRPNIKLEDAVADGAIEFKTVPAITAAHATTPTASSPMDARAKHPINARITYASLTMNCSTTPALA
jgi:hypothetical protein